MAVTLRPSRATLALSAALMIAASACASSTSSGSAGASIPATTPTPAPTAVAGAWTQVPSSATLGKIQFLAVLWTGTRYAAAGVAYPSGDAVFLDSADGVAWNLQSATWPGATVRGLSAGPAGLVAVGDRAGKMVAWTSADGLTWTLAPDASSMDPATDRAFRLGHVTLVAGAWMAVGEEDGPVCMSGCVPIRGMVWKSTDGKVWTQQPASTALLDASLKDVIQWNGQYVAVGRKGLFAAVWTSPDGTTWTQVADGPQFHAPLGTDTSMGAGMASIAASGGRLVAVGEVFTQGDVGSALAWWSNDGKTWNAATGEKFLNGQAFRVSSTPVGFLAVGPSGEASCLGGIWSSPSGESWSCEASAAPFSGFAPYDVATSPTGQIVVGFGRADGSMTGAAWTRTLTEP